MHLRKSDRRKVSLLTGLGFMVQMLAVSVCQMGVSTMAMAADSGEHDMHMERQCVDDKAVHQSDMNTVSSEPDSKHHAPCSHCNQPDELVSVAQISNLSLVSMPLLYAHALNMLQLQTENGMRLGSYIPSVQPPGNVPLIYRTSQRIRI